MTMDWKETKEALAFGLGLIKAGFDAKANDGKFDIMDLPLLMSPMMQLPAAIDGAGKIPQELAPGEFTPDEQDELKAFVIATLGEFPGVQTKWLTLVRAALMISQGIYLGYTAFQE